MEITATVKTVKAYTDEKAMSEAVKALENLYDALNIHVARCYGAPIKLPVLITVQTKGKRSAYAWVTLGKTWQNKGQDFAYELNIAAETLARDFKDTFQTMIHEMLHLKNIELGIKDCSSTSQRHNKAFKEACDKVGLYVEQMGNYGWCRHGNFEGCSEELRNVCDLFAAEHAECVEALTIQMKDYNAPKLKGGKKKSNQVKYVCPCCGASVRATSKVNIMCADCNEMMVPEL